MAEFLKKLKRILIVIALALAALVIWGIWTGHAATFIEWLQALWEDAHPAITERNLPPVEGELDGAVRIHFIDVGQGDATFVEFPDGSCMLVDAGIPERGGDVVAFIRSLGYDRIDCVLATHPHQDHIGGLDVVIRALEIGQVWAPDASNTTLAYYDFLAACADTGETIELAATGSTLMLGNGWRADVISPRKGASFPDLNQASAIVLLQVGETRVLLPADASISTIARATNIRIDVLKVGHHGSLTSTSDWLVDRLRPTVAVVSYGIGNPYGLPSGNVLSMLSSAELYGTGANGTVVLTLDGSTVEAEVEREGTPESGASSYREDRDSPEVYPDDPSFFQRTIEGLHDLLFRTN
ncbi:MAG: MBL fold metallo-hydrolase [Atopobiaceae bacterium]|nr:MBL fold metallo-hydrolase [Atopobiaceae bacterium]